MEVTFTKTSSGRTHVVATNDHGSIFTEHRFVLHHGNNQIASPLTSGLLPLKWEFDIEDYANILIAPYPNQTTGTFRLVRQVNKYDWPTDTQGPWEDKNEGTFTYPIYSNDVTCPVLTSVAINSSPLLLNDNSLYVKTLNGIKVSAQAEAKLNASIVKIEWKAGNSAFQNGETSPVFATFGEIPITITATDTRGFVATHTDKITVYDYQNPTISPISGAASVLVARALSNGTLSERGSYIKVEVQKKYSSVGSKNTCKLMYRVKEQGEDKNWSIYTTLLDDSSSNEFNGLLTNVFDIGKRYVIELSVVDTFGNSETLTYLIASEKVFMDRRGESNSIAFGGHITESDEKGVHEIYQKAFIKGGMVFVDSTTGSKYNITVENGALKATKIT
jgi:hypothetical protein